MNMNLEAVYERNLEHKIHKAGWLRAAVLGANDGLVSTASLMIGIASAGRIDFLFTGGAAGIAAGAMSMAVGEYVSVRSQNDIEESDRKLEMEHLAIDPESELEELTVIYENRGLPRDLAVQVATAMHEKDALEAHLRDELGQFEHTKARPVQAGVASAISFTLGGMVPLLGALAPSGEAKVYSILGFTLIGLVLTGYVSSNLAGSAKFKTTLRIVIGGAIGMAITAGIGSVVQLSGI
jgi:VIT1/CCC1 family predicted Fe2+/Mn2+ transporter